MILVLLVFVISAVSSCSYSLDQDLVDAVQRHLEPSLHGKFTDLRESYKRQLPTSDCENTLLEGTRSEKARELLGRIPAASKGDLGSFGNIAKHGYGDKYRLLLALAQQAPLDKFLSAPFIFHYHQWSLFDGLSHNMILSRELFKRKSIFESGETVRLGILESVLAKMFWRFERQMARVCCPYAFLRKLEESTHGVIFRVGEGEDVLPEDNNLVNFELLLLLPPLTRLEIPADAPNIKACTVERTLDKTENSMQREYFKRAFLHWRQLQVSNRALQTFGIHFDLNPSDAPQICDGLEKMVRFRMHTLQAALDRIFTWDMRVSPRLLHASWCLGQYLKYTSRLLLNHKDIDYEVNRKLRTDLQNLVQDYALKLDAFLHSVKARMRIERTIKSAPGLCRFPNRGAKVRDILVMSAPIPFGGQPHYFVSPVQAQVKDGDWSMGIINPGKEEWTDLLVVISEPTFEQPELIEQIIGKVISTFSATH